MKRVLLTLFFVAVATGAAFGWRWLMDITVLDIDVRGDRYVSVADVLDIMAVDTGMVMFNLDPRILADRVERLPWVAEAGVARLPTGRVVVDLVEREPVAMAMTADAGPAYYLDRNGFRMPLPDSSWYDVPLVTGLREPYHPVTPVSHGALRDMLMLLPDLEPETDALLSEIRIRGDDLDLWLTPVGTHGAIPVRLGRKDLAPKLRELTMFWEKEVLRHQATRFELIDLRFDGQIVTRETSR